MQPERRRNPTQGETLVLLTLQLHQLAEQADRNEEKLDNAIHRRAEMDVERDRQSDDLTRLIEELGEQSKAIRSWQDQHQVHCKPLLDMTQDIAETIAAKRWAVTTRKVLIQLVGAALSVAALVAAGDAVLQYFRHKGP